MELAATPEARSVRRLYARVAGGAYLAIVLAAVVYGALVESQLIVPGDDAITAANILANPLRFRIGIVLVFIIYASVVVASWALFIVLRDVHKNLALLALLFRMAEAVVGAATILISFSIWYLLSGEMSLSAEGSAPAFSPNQLHALAGCLVDVRTAGLDVVLLFIGVGATLFCYLLFRSRIIPRPLAGWGIFTYLSMLVLALISILIPDHPSMLETILYFAGSGFELIFGLWLLAKAIDA